MKFYKFALILLAIGFILPGCKPRAKGPNVILVSLDTVRPDHLSVYGYFRKTTPFLERLSEESVTFNNAYTPCPHTVTAHTSLFTSAYPSEHKTLYNGWKLKDWSKPLLAEVLKKAGYQTGAVVSSAVLASWHNLNRGFEFYHDKDFEHQVGIVKKKENGPNLKIDFNQRRASEVINWAQKWLNEIDPKQPFFLFLHFYDAHRPYDPDPNYNAPFKLDPEFIKYLTDNHYLMQDKYDSVNTYDNQLSYLDYNLEKFFSYLKSQGLLDKTLIIITADHGEGLGQHNLMSHGLYLYEDQVRIPLIIRFPDKASAGMRIDARVNLIDIAPTILEYLKLKDPMEPRGTSLLGIIQGVKKQPRSCEFFERRWYEPSKRAKGRKAGALCDEWKIIWADEEENELYNLNSDKFELTNLREMEQKKFLELESEVKKHLDDVKFFSVQKQTIPKEVQEQLKALGYTR